MSRTLLPTRTTLLRYKSANQQLTQCSTVDKSVVAFVPRPCITWVGLDCSVCLLLLHPGRLLIHLTLVVGLLQPLSHSFGHSASSATFTGTERARLKEVKPHTHSPSRDLHSATRLPRVTTAAWDATCISHPPHQQTRVARRRPSETRKERLWRAEVRLQWLLEGLLWKW